MDEMNKEYSQVSEPAKTEPERQDWWPTGDEEPEPQSRKESWPTQPDEESGVYSSSVRRKDYIGPEPVQESRQEKPEPEPWKIEETKDEKRTRTNFDPQDYNYQEGQKTAPGAADRMSYTAQAVTAVERNPFVTAAIILGILSILFTVTGVGGLFFGGMGVIAAVLSRGRGAIKGKAKAGLFISLFGFCVSLVITISAFNMIFSMTTGEMKEMFRQYGYVLQLPGEEESIFPSGDAEDADEKEEFSEEESEEKSVQEPAGSEETPFEGDMPFSDASHAVEL